MGVSSRERSRRAVRRALVTGASAGIGAAFAERLAHDGWDLYIVARRRQRLEDLARHLRREHGVGVEVVVADLTDAGALRRLERRVARDERLDLLINNAGIADFGHFIDLDRDVEEAEIRLDIIAVVRLTHAVLPGMVRRRRGSVINVSSLAAVLPGPNYAVYTGCKSFINAFTEALHFELAGTGVRFQTLCPGLTRTEIFEAAHADTSNFPWFMWADPPAVVDESLSALERGTLVCVPGLANQALSTLTSWMPAEAAGRIANFFSDRAIVHEPAVKTKT
jgi:short-subunit dehydrogenase